MWKQKDLFGKPLPMNERNPEKPPEGACSERCFDAEGEVCTCRCGGAYHGLGRLNKRTRDSDPSEKPRMENEKKCLRK